MRRLLIAALLWCVALNGPAFARSENPQPVNAHASPEAKALLAYIQSISGKGIITGQHNFPNDGSRWTDLAFDLTGKYPGLFGEDFGFSAGEDKDSTLSRPAMIAEAKRQWQHGAVVALTWHEVRPTDDEPVTFHDSVQGRLTDYEWHDLLTPGTPLYNRWCEQVDVVAGFLRQLRDQHVPVLFRPYHEVNGNWFWWGYRPGRDGSAALYRQLYHRFVDVHHLDNLVWVWNVNAPGGNAGALADYYPGAEFVDIASIDIYGEFKQEYYDSMLALAGDKPIALAEVGAVPPLEVLARQPRWTYFMVWSGFSDPERMEATNALYHSPQAINRDDPRLAEPMEKIRAATAAAGDALPFPVAPNNGKAAVTLLAQINEHRGKAILSGQTMVAGASIGSQDKQPDIVAMDLDASSADSVLNAATQAASHHQMVLLNWRPARPTDGGAAASSLTDYEWQQLFTGGTEENRRWTHEIEEAAKTLRTLEKAGVAVLWNPCPESNNAKFWWGGRKAIHGSAALYRTIFEKLSAADGPRNLVWVWEADAPAFGAASPGTPQDYFPGLLYVDALELHVTELHPGPPADWAFRRMSAGKPLGIDIAAGIPAPDLLTRNASWTWFVLADTAQQAPNADLLNRLYADPHVHTATPAQ